MVRPALAGLQMPLVEKGLPDLGHVSIEASTASRSPGLLPGRWPDAARPLTPLWFCYVDLRPHPRKGSLQGTPLPVAEPPRNQGLNLGWRLWASPPGPGCKAWEWGGHAPLVAHGLFFPAAALEVGGPCCPPGGEGLLC